MEDPQFQDSMNNAERDAWVSLTVFGGNFLWNYKADNYTEKGIVFFRQLGSKVSIKVHYLHRHLDRFPENLREQGGRFQQGRKIPKTLRYRRDGRFRLVNLMRLS